jgi:FlaA1/EpsC-like NDP-sugar epimerase
MTIPEAVQLVLQAGVMGTGGEVFVLDMGEQIRIADLARDLIRLSGFDEGKDVDIVYTGLRPGEKMEEELMLASESFEKTTHEKIRAFRWNGWDHTQSDGESERTAFHEALGKLLECARTGDERCIQDLLRIVVPEFDRSGSRSESPVQQGEQKMGTPHLEPGFPLVYRSLKQEHL